MSRTAIAGRLLDQRGWAWEGMLQPGCEMRITAWATLGSSVWVSTGSNEC